VANWRNYIDRAAIYFQRFSAATHCRRNFGVEIRITVETTVRMAFYAL
jgi:hypothetical protein